jgi:hypothetical protein
MMKAIKFIGDLGERVAYVGLLALLIGAALTLVGCAVGRGAAGEVILGVEAGRLADTAERGLIGAVGMIPGVGPALTYALGGAVAGGWTVKGGAAAALKLLEKKRKASDIAREAAEKRVVELEATNGG